MPQIINTSNSSNDTEAQAKAASRPEPTFQPMRIVDASKTSNPNPAPAAASAPVDSKGKKLVRSKKEIEAEKKSVKPNRPIPTPATAIPAPPEFDRNAKPATVQYEESSEFPSEWSSNGYTRVYRAWLQTPIDISGVLSSETTFVPGLKLPGLVMASDGKELFIKVKGLFISVPYANVKCMVYKERK